MRCSTSLLVLATAILMTGCASFGPNASLWQPVSPSFVGRDVVQVVQEHVKNDPLRTGNPKWVWEDAILFENDAGHYIVWVYYVSRLRGKIWTWFEVDVKQEVIAGGGFSEG